MREMREKKRGVPTLARFLLGDLFLVWKKSKTISLISLLPYQ
jgi:hypothetical protein